MGTFDKHIGKGAVFKIGEDEYTLKPLKVEHMPLMLKAMSAFSEMNEDSDMSEFFKNMDDRSTAAIRDLVKFSLKESYPTEPDDVLEEIGMKYSMLILPAIFECNLPKNAEMQKKQTIMKRLNANKQSPPGQAKK